MKLKVYYTETFQESIFDYKNPTKILEGFTVPGFLSSSGKTVKELSFNIRRQWRWEMELYKKEKDLAADLFEERSELFKEKNLNLFKSFEIDT